MTIDHCRSCRKQIYRLRHAGTGKVAPIDYEPDDAKGNCLIDLEDSSYRIVPKEVLEDSLMKARVLGQLHTSHFATCPQAPRWRSPKAREAARV